MVLRTFNFWGFCGPLGGGLWPIGGGGGLWPVSGFPILLSEGRRFQKKIPIRKL